MEVESVVTVPPSDGALLFESCSLVGLALNAQIHDVVAADGTIVNLNVPGP